MSDAGDLADEVEVSLSKSLIATEVTESPGSVTVKRDSVTELLKARKTLRDEAASNAGTRNGRKIYFGGL